MAAFSSLLRVIAVGLLFWGALVPTAARADDGDAVASPEGAPPPELTADDDEVADYFNQEKGWFEEEPGVFELLLWKSLAAIGGGVGAAIGLATGFLIATVFVNFAFLLPSPYDGASWLGMPIIALSVVAGGALGALPFSSVFGSFFAGLSSLTIAGLAGIAGALVVGAVFTTFALAFVAVTEALLVETTLVTPDLAISAFGVGGFLGGAKGALVGGGVGAVVGSFIVAKRPWWLVGGRGLFTMGSGTTAPEHTLEDIE